jgi:two-component system response regulator (stage 0 sporulation protein A)
MINHKINVLIVDDNREFTKILCDYINFYINNGINIIGVASDGLDAIKMITDNQPDIVILDIVMPYVDGIGVLKKIKELEMKKKPLFIMLSALGNSKVIQEAMKFDATCFIIKPFDMDVLISKIIKLQSQIILNRPINESIDKYINIVFEKNLL